MKKFGLIGYPLEHSFSFKYFNRLFEDLELKDHQYQNYPIENLDHFLSFLADEKELVGLNVTTPHKTNILKYLDALSIEAAEIGAVNTIIVHKKNGLPFLEGFNTDVIGFEASIKPLLKLHHTKALVLGTGGAARAVAFVFKKLGIEVTMVSSSNKPNSIPYEDLDEKIMSDHLLVINASTIGMYPANAAAPKIPYQYLTAEHLAFDLIYNPDETMFLHYAGVAGATTKNGLEMLYLQAEAAWKIWNTKS